MLTMKDVIREGDPILRNVAKEVSLPASEEDTTTLKEMIEFVINSQDPEMAEKYSLRPGIGLAAPQIGVSKKMIAVHVTDADGTLYSHALFNPKIISHSVERTYLQGGEGCLSVDREVPGYVPRYTRITVKATSINGEEVKLRLKGLPAIVFQHEIDHLNGVMFYDHINKENPFAAPDDSKPLER
ncbi:TPA: peptide deformylase [Bacillus cereus]|uniref:peptide deformylase n=1 Tax=Bacillus cereus group TaxID=86661 RepID=UPI000BEB6510|nr:MULTISPECIES: peptide deformylase [Bacillus cereus group]PED02009.1 peptide deformylase [Bacillus cereus]PED90803.1 peptide deformylase [Bacillus cereus]PEQ43242.1 peptide deformylase [Bacillus cereus]PER64987.1 peptide deformylase [Bacillus cereus]PEV65749.1 peptide deformylase [Bacillus cereus]